MKAYGIFDGGGVKAAALAGCLAACHDLGIKFVGFGGTSAGSIVAFLGALGCTRDELEAIAVRDLVFREFLDDSGTALNQLKALPDQCSSPAKTALAFWRNRHLLHRLSRDLGLYQANALRQFVLQIAGRKIPALRERPDISFHDLRECGCRPLKVMVSDLGTQQPRVYSGGGGADWNGSVLEAIRASISYPFVFQPVRRDNRYLVDGGLASNLPVFLFEEERRHDRVPVIAFDLVTRKTSREFRPGFRSFCGDMLSTALESGDVLLLGVLQNIYHVPVPIPEDIDALDFDLPEEKRRELFRLGSDETHQFFMTKLPQWGQVRTTVEALQALHAPPRQVVPILKAFAEDVERQTNAQSVRAHVMLPTIQNTRIIVYQYGMDDDPDMELELAMEAGCTGRTWVQRQPTFGDLQAVETSTWRMTREQMNRVRNDRKTVFSTPIFDTSRLVEVGRLEDLDMIGQLCIDTETPIRDTLWLSTQKEYLVQTSKVWADILSKIIR